MAKPSISYALRQGEAMRPGLLRILKSMGERARALAAKPDRDVTDSIHELRTLIKRLRAYLWLIGPVLGKARLARSNEALRQAAQSLSPARDVQAVKSALSQAAVLESPPAKRQSLAQVSPAMAGSEAGREKSLVAFAPVKLSAATLTQIVAETIAQAKRSRAKWPLPEDRVVRALRSMRKAEKRTRQADDASLIHDWRKKTKRLFYLLQLTERLPEMDAGDAIKRVDKLQDLLGNHQDAVVAENYLRKHAGEIDAGHLARARNLLKRTRKALLKDARRCWQKMRRDF